MLTGGWGVGVAQLNSSQDQTELKALKYPGKSQPPAVSG